MAFSELIKNKAAYMKCTVIASHAIAWLRFTRSTTVSCNTSLK